MEYKKITIFEKYNFEPNIEKEKIRVLFQTDPNKRKELPIVLKTISSNELLYEEELFTQRKDNADFAEYNKMLEILDSTKKGYISSEIKNLSKYLIIIANDKDFYNKFYYSSKISNDRAEKIFDEFLNCIIDKITREFNSSIGEISNEELKKMYNAITSIFSKTEKFEDNKKDFDEDICDCLNNSLSLDTNGKDLSKRLNSLVSLKNVIKNEFYSDSIKYIIGKMSNDISKYGDTLIDIYEELCNSFKGKDLKEVSSFITVFISNNIYIRADNNPTKYKKNYKNLKKIQKICWLYEESKTIEDEQFDSFSELCDYFVYAGEEWITSYSEAYKKIIEAGNKDSIYDIVEIIAEKLPSPEVFRIFSNVITDVTGFNYWLDYILETHKDSIDGKSDKYINPKDVDSFIAKYYWLVYSNYDSNINKTFFDNIRNIAFDILEINAEDIELLKNPYLDRRAKLLIRRKVLNTYELFPGDWIMDDGKTIKSMFSELGEPFDGKDGESTWMIRRYEALFRSLKGELDDVYSCPTCDYYISEDEEKCPKCGTIISWIEEESEIVDNRNDEEESKTIDNSIDEEDEEEPISNNDNNNDSFEPDYSGIIFFLVMCFIIFVIIIASLN